MDKLTRYSISGIIAAAMLLVSQAVSAVAIEGEISFFGGLQPITSGGLKEATGIDFWDPATGYGTDTGAFWVAPDVTGDFASYLSAGDMGTINDFYFVEPFSSVAPLWEVGGFKFDLTSVVIEEQTDTTLILSGSGYVHGNEFDRTTGAWTLTAQTLLGTSFSWSSTTAAVAAVSESGSLALLAIGLLGLGFYRRK